MGVRDTSHTTLLIIKNAARKVALPRACEWLRAGPRSRARMPRPWHRLLVHRLHLHHHRHRQSVRSTAGIVWGRAVVYYTPYRERGSNDTGRLGR